MSVSTKSEWYVKKGMRVQGPFNADEVGRFLLLGRVHNTDKVSRDGENWEPVTQVPELVCEELLNIQSDDSWNRFMDHSQPENSVQSQLMQLCVEQEDLIRALRSVDKGAMRDAVIVAGSLAFIVGMVVGAALV